MRKFSFWAAKRSKKVKSRKTADSFTKMVLKWPCTLIERMELRLFLATLLLSWTLLLFCVSASFLGKVLDLNTSLILFGKWSRSSPAVRRALFACFFFSNVGLQLATGKLKSSVLCLSWVQVGEAWQSFPTKLLTAIFYSKLSSLKCSVQTCECFEGLERSFTFL